MTASTREAGGACPPPAVDERWLRSARLVVILGGLSAFAPLSLDMYLPALPALAHDLHAGAASVQLTLSACLLGLALGQVVAGPLSDTFGRRRPLLLGVAAYVVASLLCVAAPSVGVLLALRFVQGCAGAAGIVISRAVVRDLHTGAAAARYFAVLMLVNGLAPILAPVVGGQALRLTSWRGVFVILAALGLLLLLASARGLRETLPPAERHTGGMGATLRTFRALLTQRSFMGVAVASGLSFAAMFAYISGSSFVYQQVYGVSAQGFSLLFGLNALGIMAASQVSGRLVGRIPPRRLLMAGLCASAAGGIALLGAVVAGLGLGAVAASLFVVVASQGCVLPNATALALSGHPRTAGSASALLGVTQYAVAAALGPLVGLGGAGARPMAVVILACALGALLVGLLALETRPADAHQ